jgi:hypothetical protein
MDQFTSQTKIVSFFEKELQEELCEYIEHCKSGDVQSFNDKLWQFTLGIGIMSTEFYHSPATSPPLAALPRASSWALVLRISDPVSTSTAEVSSHPQPLRGLVSRSSRWVREGCM